jgi:uncharacterized membrane protein
LGQNKETQNSEVATSFYSEFVLANLLHIKDLKPAEMGLDTVVDFMLRSTTVILAFQALPLTIPLCLGSLLKQYIYTMLDHCSTLISDLDGRNMMLFAKAAEYLFSELCLFMKAAKLVDAFKALLLELVKKCLLKINGNTKAKSSLLFILPVLSKVAREYNSFMEYKDRDSLLSGLVKLNNACQEKLTIYVATVFKGIKTDEKHLILLCYLLLSNSFLLLGSLIRTSLTPFSSELSELAVNTVKQCNYFCAKFDNSVRDRIRFSRNFFAEFFLPLPNFRETRRQTALTRIYTKLKTWQAHEDSEDLTKQVEE